MFGTDFDRISNVTRKNLRLYVVSHDPELLSAIPNASSIAKRNLNDLDIDINMQGQLLAESRIFFSKEFLECDSDYIGLATPRWGERFPKWPSLTQLLKPVQSLDTNEFAAPQALRSTTKGVENWIKAQNLVHPGISELLMPIWLKVNFSDDGIRWLPTGNSFIFEKEQMRTICRVWHEVVSSYNKQDFQELPFGYRCVKCGLESDDGIGRWRSNRHASYFLERVTALIVASQPNLHAIAISKSGDKKKKSFISTTKGLPITAELYTAISTKFHSPASCDHIHFGPGKA